MQLIRTLVCFVLLAAVATAQEFVLSHNSSLRSGPSAGSDLLQTLPADTPVTIISKAPRKGYVKIKAKDGPEGWVWRRNVAEVKGEEKHPTGGAMNLASVNAKSRAGGDMEIYPNAELTPGALDSRVTQANIKSTICKPGYTKTVRPPVSVTSKIKQQTMAAYGFTDSPQYYELDHLISLELGGCPACVTNLWPEMWGDSKHPIRSNQKRPNDSSILPGARQKDQVENYLHDQVCSGAMTLRVAQQQIAADWYRVYVQISKN